MTDKDDLKKQGTTQHLSLDKTLPVVPRGTGPLDYALPWVIELRIKGTHSVVQVEVREYMVMGRGEKQSGTHVDIDLGPHNAYAMGVSRKHALISARNSRITVRDLDSANGTYLNGGRLESGRDYRLRHGDLLTLGKMDLQVVFVVTPSSYEKNSADYADVNIPVIGSGQRVLLVDDDDKVTQTLGTVLKQAGFEVSIAYTITEALMMVDKAMPDAVVMELVMADMSGLELVYYIRQHPDGHDVPLVAVSGAAAGYQMGKAMQAGVDIFLTKPVGVDEFLRSFRELMPQMNR